MITNVEDPFQEQEEQQESAVTISSDGGFDELLKRLKERRQTIINGGINCIPLPFKRFRSEIPGIEQGQYVVVTANQKTGKTSFVDFFYVFYALDYAFEHPTQCSVHIIYFSLEEAVEKVRTRYLSHLLYKLDGIRISPADLRSTSSAVSEDILNSLDSEKYRERLRFMEKCVQFETEDTNPTGILRVCQKYAKSVGDYRCHKAAFAGQSGRQIEVFDSYRDTDPNHYKIVIVDHIGLVDKEQGFRTKDAVDKMSEYCVKYLRNRLNYTCVMIQQQAADAEGLEATKQKRIVPSSATLGDSKYTGRDVDLLIGLFNPSKFGLGNWLGYKIQDIDGTGLRDYARFLYVLENRNGEMGGVCPLFFDGACCWYEELPKPDEVDALTKYYVRVKNIRNTRIQKKVSDLLMFMITKIFHK